MERRVIRISIGALGILMDLNKDQALKTPPKTMDGEEYLFIQAGGFSAQAGNEWKGPLCVMVRR